MIDARHKRIALFTQLERRLICAKEICRIWTWPVVRPMLPPCMDAADTVGLKTVRGFSFTLEQLDLGRGMWKTCIESIFQTNYSRHNYHIEISNN